MIPDVKINDISMFESGWLRESIDFPTPKSQTNTVTVPGRNTPVRFSKSLGIVFYQPREFTIVISMLGNRDKFNSMYKEAVNAFSGQLCRVVLSEEPDLYAVGTLELTPSYDPKTGRGTINIECKDGDSYRYHKTETVVEVSTAGNVYLTNDFMPTVPTVKTTAETRLVWEVDDTIFDKTVSAGTWTIPELQLSYGENSITVLTEGTVTFTYREGCL